MSWGLGNLSRPTVSNEIASATERLPENSTQEKMASLMNISKSWWAGKTILKLFKENRRKRNSSKYIA